MKIQTMTVGNLDSDDQGSGARASGGKVKFSMVPLHLLAGCARVFMSGAIKYKEWNWAKGMPWSEAYDPLLRHLFKWWYCRDEMDIETQEHHLDHAICNLLMLRHYVSQVKQCDDRPPTHIHFTEELQELNKLFDKAAYLDNNPDIVERVDE